MEIIGTDLQGNNIDENDILKCVKEGHFFKDKKFHIHREKETGKIYVKLINEVNGTPIFEFATLAFNEKIYLHNDDESFDEEALNDFIIFKKQEST